MNAEAWTGLYGFVVLLTLVGLNIPIGLAMGIVGFGGLWLLIGPMGALNALGIVGPGDLVNANLSVVPLFVLMGLFAGRAGLSAELFRSANAFVGHIRGGLTMANIAASAGFGAICGSSLATAATMSKVALPEMRRHGYKDTLAAGSIAAGGTLGILIPPSIMLVLYAIITETPLRDLFMAALVPGVMAVVFYMAAIAVITRLDPEAGPRAERADWRSRLRGLREASGVALLFLAVIGGIYGGVFTPTEAAAVGACGTLAYFLARRGLDLEGLKGALLETAGTTAMIFLILIGAGLFSMFMSFSGLPRVFAGAVLDLGLSALMVAFAIMLLYLILGCFMDSIGMLILTVPVLLPVVQGLAPELGMTSAQAAVWFGIFAIVVIEIGLLTPPFGLNVFIIRGAVRDIGLGTIYRGVVPFWIADIVRLALLILFPSLCLYIPFML